VPTSTFRLPGLLLLLGFLGVVAGTIGYMVGFVTFTAGAAFAEFLGAPIGYLLVGVAWWQWTPGVQSGEIAARSMRRTSLTLVLASLVTSLSYLGRLYGSLRFRYSLPSNTNFYLPHFRLQLAADAATGVGFIFSAVGFWIAARILKQAGFGPEHPELATANP
jgi:hypothetical protein